MTVTELGAMGVKPNMNIMDPSTPEGQILYKAWKTVVTKPGGPQRVYYGLESENPSSIWGFFDFDSVEQHRRFAEEHGAEATKDIPKICTHGEFSKHVKMIPSSEVLGSPLTEVMLAYFPQDISEEEQKAVSVKLKEILTWRFEINPAVAMVAHGWGLENDFPARSEEGKPRSVLMGFVGWTSPDACQMHGETDGYKESISRIETLKGCTSFSKFTISCQHLERV